MKALIAAMLVLVIICNACLFAQEAGPIDKGSLIIGGSASFTSSKAEGSSTRVTGISLRPSLLYFFFPSVAIGGNIHIQNTSAGYYEASAFSIGPKVAFFFRTKSDNLYPYLGASFNITSADDYTATELRLSGGLAALVVSHVAITGEFFYQLEHYDPDSEYYSAYNLNTFGVTFGITAFIY